MYKMNKFNTLYEAIVNEVDLPDEVANWIINVLSIRTGSRGGPIKQPQEYNKVELDLIKNVIYPQYRHLTKLDRATKQKIYGQLQRLDPVFVQRQKELFQKWKLNNVQRKKELNQQFNLRNKEKINKGFADREALLAYIPILIRKAKYRASKSKSAREFTITAEDVLKIWPVDNKCPALGIPLQKGTEITLPNSPSLDRIDSTKGYIPGNIAIISHRANSIKSNGTADELDRIADYMEGKI